MIGRGGKPAEGIVYWWRQNISTIYLISPVLKSDTEGLEETEYSPVDSRKTGWACGPCIIGGPLEAGYTLFDAPMQDGVPRRYGAVQSYTEGNYLKEAAFRPIDPESISPKAYWLPRAYYANSEGIINYVQFLSTKVTDRFKEIKDYPKSSYDYFMASVNVNLYRGLREYNTFAAASYVSSARYSTQSYFDEEDVQVWCPPFQVTKLEAYGYFSNVITDKDYKPLDILEDILPQWPGEEE